MQRQKKILIGKIAAIMAVVPIVILAHSAGADPRKTGAPGDSTCAQSGCHTGTVNTGGGKVVVAFSGDGVTYTPGVKQRLTVTVTDSLARVYGFQLTARLAGSDGYKTQQAGTFTPVDSTTFVLCEDGSTRDLNPGKVCSAGTPLEFIEQSQAGRPNTFTFDWTPPATASGDVKIWVAGNGANGNQIADSGDHIYVAGPYTLSAPISNKPTIANGGVADALNYQTGAASATYLGIFGTNLSTTTRDWSAAIQKGNLPMSLDGVSVTINGKPAAIYSVSPGQVNVLAPVDAAVGPVQVVLTNSNGVSDPATVTKTQYLPAFYAPFAKDAAHLYITCVQSLTGEILGNAGFDPRAVRAVRPGEVILLYGTGFGQTNPPSPMDSVGPVAELAAKPLITIGQTPASFVGNGYMVSPGFVQFNLTVPDLLDGDYQIRANIGGILSSDKVYITIKR